MPVCFAKGYHASAAVKRRGSSRGVEGPSSGKGAFSFTEFDSEIYQDPDCGDVNR